MINTSDASCFVQKDTLSQPAVVDFELGNGRTLTQLLKGGPALTPKPPNPIQPATNPINNEVSGNLSLLDQSAFMISS